MATTDTFTDWLEKAGYTAQRPSGIGTELEFTPERMIGLIVQSLLSSHPRTNFFTDGEKIFVPRIEHPLNKAVPDYDKHVLLVSQEFDEMQLSEYPMPKNLTEGVLRESLVAKLMGIDLSQDARSLSFYGDQTLLFDTAGAFPKDNGYVPSLTSWNQPPLAQQPMPISAIPEYDPGSVPSKLILKDEHRSLTRRIRRNKMRLIELLNIMDLSEEPLPEYSRKLEQELANTLGEPLVLRDSGTIHPTDPLNQALEDYAQTMLKYRGKTSPEYKPGSKS